MPAVFHPDLLRASLAALSAAAPLDDHALAYQRRYGLPPATALGRFDAAGFEVVGQLWRPDRPVATLFLLHGYYDHMGLYGHVIRWALAQGFAVIACDLPGHGLSSGLRASIADFAAYQHTLEALFTQAAALNLPQPWHLCGQSTGGAIVVDHALHAGDASPAQGELLLLAPLVRPHAWGWSKLSYHVLRHFVDGLDRRFTANSTDSAFLPFLKADPLQPRRLTTAWVGALVRWIDRIEAAPRSARRPIIIQGEDDTTVDWRHNLGVLQSKFAAPHVLQLPGARHHLANETAAFRERYFDFLSERLRQADTSHDRPHR